MTGERAVRVTRKTRRILMAIHYSSQPLTGGMLCHVTCHWPGTVYPALDRLEEAGWIRRQPGRGGVPAFELTDRGRQCAGLLPKEGG